MALELQNERIFDLRERRMRRYVVWLLVALVVTAPFAIWLGPTMFHRFQQQRLLGKAFESKARGNLVDMAIFLRRVLILNPDNVEAMRAMADLAEEHLPMEAAALRERICKKLPESYADALAWAQTALKVGYIPQASDAFEHMKRIGAASAEHFEIGARISLAQGNQAGAHEGFTKALQIAPDNRGLQLELAALDLRAGDHARRTQAATLLQEFRSDAMLRAKALRALTVDCLARQRAGEALGMAAELIREPAAPLADRLLYLDALRLCEMPGATFLAAFEQQASIDLGLVPNDRPASFAAFLDTLQGEARDNAASITQIIGFLNARGQPLLAVEWASRLSIEFLNVPPVAPALAESYRLTGSWARLEALLHNADWGAAEFLRLAYVARVERQRGDAPAAAAAWTQALQQSEYHLDRLDSLARLASGWGWSDEWESMLWTAVKTSKRPKESLLNLFDFYAGRRDSLKLFDVATRILDVDPSDLAARKRWTRLSFLLKGDPYRTGAAAEELYRAYPKDPDIAVTYALLQIQREKPKQALVALEKLSPEELRSPLHAGFYGIILAANGRSAEAADFLQRAKGAPLLREELELIERARRKLE